MDREDKTAGQITRLLQSHAAGDGSALDALLPLVYDDLKRVAANLKRRQGGALQTTEIVHDAYLKLSRSALEAVDRRHFYAVAANAMRFLLVDEARRRLRKKRGAGAPHRALETWHESVDQVLDPDLQAEEILALHEALEKLGGFEPRWRSVVESRFFAGYDEETIAEMLAVSVRTVRRDWAKARAWLLVELASPEAALADS